jgi:hypothetical protein
MHVERVQRQLSRSVEALALRVDPPRAGRLGNLLHADSDLHIGGHSTRADGLAYAPFSKGSATLGTLLPSRSTARCALVALLLLVAIPGGLAVGATHGSGVPRLLFPVVGPATYTDDFGDARGALRHEGNDLLAAKRQLAVAVESGTVTFWTTSASAGCMLYLHGVSGTTYQYIHLNNDLTAANDNKGKCAAGTSYAKGLKDGAHVEAGQPIGYVGDSGDANGIHPHLHFEVHPHDGKAVDPFPFLNKARHLLFAAPPGSDVSVALTGTLVSVDDTALEVEVASLHVSTGLRVVKVNRIVSVVPDVEGGAAALEPGARLRVTTLRGPLSLAQELGTAGALSAASVVPLDS